MENKVSFIVTNACGHTAGKPLTYIEQEEELQEEIEPLLLTGFKLKQKEDKEEEDKEEKPLLPNFKY